MTKRITDKRRRPRPAGLATPTTSELTLILGLLHKATGHDLSHYKKNSLSRRIKHRMGQLNIKKVDEYLHYLQEHSEELPQLFLALLINVTHLFRDPEVFALLQAEILPQLFDQRPEDATFRVWVAGCATGEEAYSIAILLHEFRKALPHRYTIQIYATDLDDHAIAIARAGRYPATIAQELSAERLRLYFVEEENGYRIIQEIREMVVFTVQNIITDPPLTALDLLSCRNVLIYLEPSLQHQLISIFHYALKPNGVLLLSPSESIGNHPDLFSVINRRWKLYRARHPAAP